MTSYRQDPPSLMFEVIDTGCGIRDEDLNKLFKLFGFLTSSQELNANGVGLGLYICKKLANKLDGDVTVKSIFGEGSTFILTLPLEKSCTNDVIECSRFLNDVQ